jgi:hypothetical protein
MSAEGLTLVRHAILNNGIWMQVEVEQGGPARAKEPLLVPLRYIVMPLRLRLIHRDELGASLLLILLRRLFHGPARSPDRSNVRLEARLA